MSDGSLAVRLRGRVQALASGPRAPGTPGHEQARFYITDELRRAGFEVLEAAGNALRGAGMRCVNVLTRPEPADERLPLVVVGAHYDSVPGCPGADDNASAVAALLELAHHIGPRLRAAVGLGARLQLVAYDLEEYGLIGSRAHSQALHAAGTELRGMMALEMLGYADPRPGSQRLPGPLAGRYPDTGDFIGVIANEASVGLLEEVVAGLKGVPGLPVEFVAVPGDGRILGDVRRSDHSPFWDRGFPAVMVTDTSFLRNPHYHQATDTPDTLDYEFLAKVTEGVCAAVWRLLESDGGRPG